MYDEDYDADWPDAEDQTIPCPACGVEIYDDAPRCNHCGEYISDSQRSPARNTPKWQYYLVIVIVALTILSFVLPYFASLLRLAN